MLKMRSKELLWTEATNNIYFGGCSALVKANRMKDTEGSDIVSRVYSVSAVQENPFTPKVCEWCGCDFIPDYSPYDCSAFAFCSDSCAESYMS